MTPKGRKMTPKGKLWWMFVGAAGATVFFVTLYRWKEMFILQNYNQNFDISFVTQKADSIELPNATWEKDFTELKKDVVIGNSSLDPCELDPLKDDCENALIGFPDKPLTIKEAKLCDAKMQPALRNGYEVTCAEDPTCLKCREKEYKNHLKLSNAYHRTSKQREQRLKKWFPFKVADKRSRPTGKSMGRDIIVCSVNFGQLYLFLNWACSCIKNNVFDPTEYVWIVPTDNQTYNTLNRLGFKVEPLDWLDDSVHISSSYKGSANSGPHAAINNILAYSANFAVQRGYGTLLMDVDLVFLQDPFIYLNKAGKRRDLLGMFSPRWDSYGFVNTGFLYLIPTRKTKILMQTYENLTLLKATSDQVLFNSVLRIYLFQQIAQRILPRSKFFTLWRSTEKYGYNRNTTILVHAVSSGKAERFKKIGLWYLDDQCPVFDKKAYETADAFHLIGTNKKQKK